MDDPEQIVMLKHVPRRGTPLRVTTSMIYDYDVVTRTRHRRESSGRLTLSATTSDLGADGAIAGHHGSHASTVLPAKGSGVGHHRSSHSRSQRTPALVV